MRHFFFSYSRADAVDPYLDRFYDDLCREVSVRGGLDLASVGFLDREQAAGVTWPAETGEALGNCRTFVPVYSRHYFASHICGQEWHTYSARMTAHHAQTGIQSRGIVPVWWVPVEEVPDAAQYLQDTRDKFGEKYRDHGLRYLLQRSDNANDYQEFLVRYSEMLLEAAKTAPDPLPVPDLLSVPNAFAPVAPPAPADERTAGSRRGSGPRKVVFVFAVGDRSSMLRVTHSRLDVYGDDWTDWRPYHPASSDSIAVRAQGVAATRKMTSSVVPADESLFDLLERPVERPCLVVLIVDPWSVGLAAYQALLTRLDRTRSRNSVVLVPWDGDEICRSPQGRRAYDRLYSSLGNWMDSGDGAFRGELPSMEEFERVLGQVLIEIQGRIMRRAAVKHRVNEIGPQYRPILTGPGGLGR
ncbi:TIR-like protein FxsC [Streptomyces avermitilis]